MKLNVKELIDFFDNKKDDIRHDISSVIGVVGEDLGAALFKHYYEKKYRQKVTISPFPVLGVTEPGTKKGEVSYVVYHWSSCSSGSDCRYCKSTANRWISFC